MWIIRYFLINIGVSIEINEFLVGQRMPYEIENYFGRIY